MEPIRQVMGESLNNCVNEDPSRWILVRVWVTRGAGQYNLIS